MNKYIMKSIRIFIIGIFALNFASCSGLLDKNPLDQIASQTFWSNEKEANMALAGVYSRLYAITFHHNDGKTDVMAGEAEANQGQAWVQIARGQIESTSGSLINEIYNNSYLGIGACNFFLENIDKAPISADLLKTYKAEVQFLRAYFYFNLADVYGGVPLNTKTVTIEEAKVKQSTKAEVITQVIKDLDAAIANLPDVAYTNGHAVKGSALALKARVLLTMSQWPEAAAAANLVMTSGKFSLYNDFRKLFLATGQSNNPEIMFSTRFLNPDQWSELDIRWNWHGVFNPKVELRDAYECTDGLPITSSPMYNPANYKLNRDPRLALTLKPFADKAIDSGGKERDFAYNGQSSSGYNPVKYGNWDALPCDYSTKSEQDWIILRYADVLLMYAEAKNEATGPDASVYKAINDIRDRTGIKMPPLPAGLTKDQMRVRIRQERRVELALEGLRWSDIKRWKTAEIYIPTLVDQGGVKRVFDKNKHYLMPFPQSEKDINKNLVQNPGY